MSDWIRPSLASQVIVSTVSPVHPVGCSESLGEIRLQGGDIMRARDMWGVGGEGLETDSRGHMALAIRPMSTNARPHSAKVPFESLLVFLSLFHSSFLLFVFFFPFRPC